jgi:exopolysaccharide production protein ExoQ
LTTGHASATNHPFAVPGSGKGSRAFAFVVLLLASGAFLNLFWNEDMASNPGNGVIGLQLAWAGIYLVVMAALWGHKPSPFRLLWNNRALLALTLLPAISTFWSGEPGLTLRRALGVMGGTVFSLFLVSEFSLAEELEVLGSVFAFSVLASLVLGIFHLGRSVDGLEGAWFGIYLQRNTLGSMMTIGGVIFLLLARVRRKGRGWSRLYGAMAFGLVLLSGSVTSWLTFLILAAALLVLPWLRTEWVRAKKTIWALAVTGVLAAALVVTQFDNVTELLGRDNTLTGRTTLWAVSYVTGLDRPWLGYGFNAFWLGTEGPAAEVLEVVKWNAPSAHNGLLETWLDLGVPGVLLVSFVFGQSFWRAMLFFRQKNGWEHAWPFLFLVLLFFLNLTESVFLSSNGFFWILFVSVALRVSPAYRQSSAGDATGERALVLP